MPLYRAELLAKKPLRYAALIHDVSQVLYLPSDYDDGSYARDRSGAHNHGTIYGATLVTGKIGMARDFDGSDDYVDLGNKDVFEPSEFTIACWVKFTKAPADWVRDWATYIAKQEPRKGYFMEGDDTDDRIHAKIGDGTGWIDVTGPSITVGKWYHTAMTYSNTTLEFFVDAVSQGTSTGTISHATTEELMIGRSPYYGNYAPVVVDEVHFFKRLLSKAELRMLMYRRFV